VVRVHQRVSVTVLEVDMERNRISLSMKSAAVPGSEKTASEQPSSAKLRPAPKSPSANKSAFNNPFAAAFKKP
jgi:uncharacterized protein